MDMVVPFWGCRFWAGCGTGRKANCVPGEEMDRNFTTIEEFSQILQSLPDPVSGAGEAAQERNGQLTKPPGSLGRMEDLAVWYAGWRGTERPSIDKVQIHIFAGNHGVTAQGVSAFPAEVTAQMVMNFAHGGAAINQLAKSVGAELEVHSLSLDVPTNDFTTGPAMDEAEFVEALRTGWEAVDSKADLLVVGEMGIGNTTCGSAIGLALFGGSSEDWTGRGTGVEGDALTNKTAVRSST